MQLIANISMLFTEVSLARRVEAAHEAGFDGVEIQFPDAGDLGPLRAAMNATGLPVVLINVPRGTGDEVGLAALPGREADFRDAVATCASQAQALSVRKVNILAGRPPEGEDATRCRRTLIENLRHAADVFDAQGVRVMVEPVNTQDVTGFHLDELDAALEVLNQAAHSNLFLQFDFYHMAITEPDLCAAIDRAAPWIGHVQFADTPGRHEPGTGGIDFDAALDRLRASGYRQEVSAEYRPAGATRDGLGWMAAFRARLA